MRGFWYRCGAGHWQLAHEDRASSQCAEGEFIEDAGDGPDFIRCEERVTRVFRRDLLAIVALAGPYEAEAAFKATGGKINRKNPDER